MNQTLQELLQFLKDIDFYKKYPSRQYLRDSIKNAESDEEKVKVILRDSLVQNELWPDLPKMRTMDNPVEYYLERRKQ